MPAQVSRGQINNLCMTKTLIDIIKILIQKGTQDWV